MRYVIAVCLSALLFGCQTTPTSNPAEVPIAAQAAIAEDLFDVMRIEFPVTEGSVTLAPSNPAETRLETLLRTAGYTVHTDGGIHTVTLHIFHDVSDALYIATVTIGTKRRLTRQYRFGLGGVRTIGTTAVGS